jgi:hypothetical protein
LYSQLTDGDNWRTRRDAVEELQNRVDNLDNIRVIRPYLKSVVSIFQSLLDDSNFNITIMAYKSFENLLEKIGVDIVPHYSMIVDKLIQVLL